MNNKSKITRWLVIYYGILQSAHLLALARAGALLWFTQKVPFPILPPTGGWPPSTMPFLFGLAGTDVIGILVGLVFAYQFIFKRNLKPMLGIVSLTIFITGAIVFAAGTFPTGAWSAHPVSYWLMVGLFIPVIPLYLQCLRTVKITNSH
jgi:hypothetical protein